MVVKSFEAVRVRVRLKIAQWPENLKAARSGNFMVWSVGSSAAGSDGQGALARYDSRQIGGQNMARFKWPAFDAIYDRMQSIPDGPERDRAVRRGDPALHRLHAVQVPRQPHRHRHELPASRRLPAPDLLAGMVALRRHRSERPAPETRVAPPASRSRRRAAAASRAWQPACRMNEPIRRDRRRNIVALLGLALAAGPRRARRGAALRAGSCRCAFVAAETGFDPAQISDLYSNTVTAHIFEALYHYDPLAVPLKIVPLTAAALPEVSSDFRTWTSACSPASSSPTTPAFGGRRRELVAADYVYSFKRYFDPATKSPGSREPERDRLRRPRRAAGASLARPRAVRLRHRGRRAEGARPLHAADPPARRRDRACWRRWRARRRSARWRARSSSSTATRSWRTRSAPALTA